MTLYNPVKEIIWVLKRSDINKYNQWFNYTNNILSKSESYNEKLFSNPYCHKYNDNIQSRDSKLSSNILKNAKICFNGIDRFNTKNEVFFNYVQPYLHHTSVKNGIYMFSFSLEPEKYQPSGCVNMSMINEVSLDFETTIPPIDPEVESVLNKNSDKNLIKKIRNSVGIEYQGTDNNIMSYVKDKEIYEYTYDLNVYIVNYNILKIMGGMAGLSYNK
jgi:hypothetical protein